MKNGRLFIHLTVLLVVQNLAAQPLTGQGVYWQPGLNLSMLSGGYAGFSAVDVRQAPIVPTNFFPLGGGIFNFLDIDYAFRNHWGIRLTAGIMGRKWPSTAGSTERLQQDFPGYFIRDISQPANPFTSGRLLLGPTFTWHRWRYFLQPSLLLGVSSFEYFEAAFKLKENGSNHLYSVRFGPPEAYTSTYSPTLVAGCKLGFFLAKRFHLFMALEGSTLRHRLRYNYTRKNEIQQIETTDLLRFKGWQYGFSVQLGMGINLARAYRPPDRQDLPLTP